VSPQLLTRDALRKVFDSFDADASGLITPDELAVAVRALGVSLPEDELRELVIDLDADGTGEISFEEFYTWWNDLVASSPVTYLHTEAEFDGVLEEEGTSGRLVVLEVGCAFGPAAHSTASACSCLHACAATDPFRTSPPACARQSPSAGRARSLSRCTSSLRRASPMLASCASTATKTRRWCTSGGTAWA
jgi:hypothetical protein